MYDSYVVSVVKPLLSKPEAFTITVAKDELGVLVTIGVAKEDMGRIIGKSGATMDSVRTLARQFGALHQARVSLKLLEPLGTSSAQGANITVGNVGEIKN